MILLINYLNNNKTRIAMIIVINIIHTHCLFMNECTYLSSSMFGFSFSEQVYNKYTVLFYPLTSCVALTLFNNFELINYSNYNYL